MDDYDGDGGEDGDEHEQSAKPLRGVVASFLHGTFLAEATKLFPVPYVPACHACHDSFRIV